MIFFLKDENNSSVINKKLSIFINNNKNDKITDDWGKVVLKSNLKPGTYNAMIKFDGDDSYNPCSTEVIVKVNKAPLTINNKNY